MNAKQRRRGYILLEAMIGGALVSTVLLGLFGQIGEAQTESSRQARFITAEQLALRDVEELRSLPFNGSLTDVTRTISGSGGGSYLLERDVSGDVTELVRTTGDVNIVYRDVTVRVTFPDRNGRRGVTTTTRVYRE